MATTLSIVQLNDTHANLLEHGDVRYSPGGFRVETLGGYARIMTKIREMRREDPEGLLVLDNGDTFHGTHEAVQSRGEVMVPYLRMLGVDAMTFHWDAAYSPAHLLTLQGELGYPVLACNVYHEGTRRLYFKPAAMLARKGLKIGVVGVASNIIRKNMPQAFWEGAEFTDGVRETAAQARKLRKQGADLVVLLSHLGYPQDVELLKQVPGIDLCLSGHTHNRITAPQRFNSAYIIQSGALASSIGLLRLTVGKKGITGIRHEYVTLDRSVKKDREMSRALARDPILRKYAAWLGEPVGRTAVDLHRASSFYSAMDNLLLDGIRAASGCEIAFSNGWRYGGAVRKGVLRRRDLYAIVPMDPEIRTARLTGEEIRAMLEDNLESTFSAQPFHQMGGYIKRNAGLKVYFKLENPYGQRIQKIFAGDGELRADQVYKVAYVTRQAVPERYGREHRGTGRRAVAAMEALLEKGPFRRGDTEGYVPV